MAQIDGPTHGSGTLDPFVSTSSTSVASRTDESRKMHHLTVEASVSGAPSVQLLLVIIRAEFRRLSHAIQSMMNRSSPQPSVLLQMFQRQRAI